MVNNIRAIKEQNQILEALTNAAVIHSPEAKREVRRILADILDIEACAARAEKHERLR